MGLDAIMAILKIMNFIYSILGSLISELEFSLLFGMTDWFPY